MDWLEFSNIHDRIRRAQLPGYALHYGEGADDFYMCIYGHNGEKLYSRDHSAAILLEWADETLTALGA